MEFEVIDYIKYCGFGIGNEKIKKNNWMGNKYYNWWENKSTSSGNFSGSIVSMCIDLNKKEVQFLVNGKKDTLGSLSDIMSSSKHLYVLVNSRANSGTSSGKIKANFGIEEFKYYTKEMYNDGYLPYDYNNSYISNKYLLEDINNKYYYVNSQGLLLKTDIGNINENGNLNRI